MNKVSDDRQTDLEIMTHKMFGFFYFQQQIDNQEYSALCVQGLQLGVKFIFNTYFRSKLKTRQYYRDLF